jgi:hypothetical protein
MQGREYIAARPAPKCMERAIDLLLYVLLSFYYCIPARGQIGIALTKMDDGSMRRLLLTGPSSKSVVCRGATNPLFSSNERFDRHMPHLSTPDAFNICAPKRIRLERIPGNRVMEMF